MKDQNLLSSNRRAAEILLPNSQQEDILTVFESIVRAYPQVKALVQNDLYISYQALNEKANYVAKCLINKGVSEGDVIAVKLDKGFDLIIAILAVMKAGAAYLPIDPTYPEVRINYMLDDSNIRHIITSAAYLGSKTEVHEINIEELDGELSENIHVGSDPQNLAYLIYTSGTTGNPKGVMVGHAGFVNMCLHQISTYQLGVNERVLQFASISFDASVYEIFIALLSGSTLVIIDKEVILERALFLAYIDRQQLTFILLPPVFLSSLGRPEFKTVKTIVTAGEACNFADALYYSQTKRYFNAYGPTEASVCVSLHQVMPDDARNNYIPIGRAIPNITFYLLDENLNPVKKGEAGELYVGGIGLAKGYINKPELTKKAFIEEPNPLGERVYRTGDIVKELADGNLVIFGRKDNQVKILGHRIEPGSIECAIMQTASITNAHVGVLEQDGDKYLCAWFTATDNISVEPLRNNLLQILPAFMVPHCFIQLPSFKLTKNGKIDKEALPSPFQRQDSLAETEGGDAEGPEGRLLRICKEVLGTRQLSLADNFFMMGGHSLKAARLAAKINKTFHVELSVSQLYKKPHIGEILEFINTTLRSSYVDISPAPYKRYYATSAAQKRMYVMSSTDKVDVSYNVSIVLRFENVIAKEMVENALKVLSERHEVLRTRFDIQFDELVQEVLPEVSINLLEGGKVVAAELSEVAQAFVQPFDLSVAPILRAGYFGIDEGGVAIIFDTHHIIADGTSIGILVNEFIRLLQQEPLPELSLQYKDYAEWESIQHAENGYFARHEQFWLNTFKDIPKLKMPADQLTSNFTHFAGERLTFKIEQELSMKLKQYAQDADVSIYQLLLSVYYLLLSKYTHQHDLVVGTAVANRKKEEVQHMMGMFVNTLALRAKIETELSFSHFVQYIKQMVLEAFDFQEYPFESLVAKLGLSGNAAKVPLIDTLFIVQNIDFFSDEAIPGLSLKYENATATSKFDFSFFIVEQKDAFVIDVEYNTSLYSQQYISQLTDDFIKLAEKAISAPSLQLEEISLMDTATLSELRAQLNLDHSIADVEFDL